LLISTSPDFEEIKMSSHNEKVERLKGILRKLGLPNLPPHIVHCESYHPDFCTRINHKFVVCDYINSKEQFNWDIGGLTILLLHKDIIEFCVAVVADGIYEELIDKIRKYRNPFLKRLVILKEREFEAWLKEQIEKSNLWKPEKLEVIS